MHLRLPLYWHRELSSSLSLEVEANQFSLPNRAEDDDEGTRKMLIYADSSCFHRPDELTRFSSVANEISTQTASAIRQTGSVWLS